VTAVLDYRHLSVSFGGGGRRVSALSDVSLSVAEGEILGIVGESGCGKTTLALAAMGLLPRPAAVEGSIAFGEHDLTTLRGEAFRRLRGDRISMVFQDASSALDPAFSVGAQIAETIRAHRAVGRREARERAIELLREVGIPDAARRYGDPPHRFSGGMQQRVTIAIALANDPALLIADEPTTALDVTIQAQILGLLRALRDRHRTTIMLIAHDLGVVAQVCDRAAVLYAGQVVEVAPVAQLFAAPRHPYTRTLLGALPSAGPRGALPVVAGGVPDLTRPPSGCRFAPRCPLRLDECDRIPPLAGGEHAVACWLDDETRRAGGLTEAAQPSGAGSEW
jgi:oligopeptide/dipeptide ABC transporter ATP-binding protein